MLSIFASVRPMEGIFAKIQPIAIRSWLHDEFAPTQPEVHLITNDLDIQQWATSYGIFWADVERVQGVPRVDKMLEMADQVCTRPYKLFCNADNLFMPGFVMTIQHILAHLPQGVVVGQRRDIELTDLSFEPGWWGGLQKYYKVKHFAACAIDYFAYKTNHWDHMPPMVVGRQVYDQWMLHECLKANIPVVDATPHLDMFHLKHGGKEWKGDPIHEDLEQQNLTLADGYHHVTIKDTQFVYTNHTIRRR